MIGKIDRKKWYSFKLFLYVLPFLVLVLLFAYYPLYGGCMHSMTTDRRGLSRKQNL